MQMPLGTIRKVRTRKNGKFWAPPPPPSPAAPPVRTCTLSNTLSPFVRPHFQYWILPLLSESTQYLSFAMEFIH